MPLGLFHRYATSKRLSSPVVVYSLDCRGYLLYEHRCSDLLVNVSSLEPFGLWESFFDLVWRFSVVDKFSFLYIQFRDRSSMGCKRSPTASSRILWAIQNPYRCRHPTSSCLKLEIIVINNDYVGGDWVTLRECLELKEKTKEGGNTSLASSLASKFRTT